MPEPLSTTVMAGYAMALYLASRSGSAVSPEAENLRRSASDILKSAERSIVLFGAKNAVISDVHAIATECQMDGWDGEEGLALSPVVENRAVEFIHALPAGLPLPQVACEPDGGISFDWISGRTRVFSVSVGSTHRLA